MRRGYIGVRKKKKKKGRWEMDGMDKTWIRMEHKTGKMLNLRFA